MSDYIVTVPEYTVLSKISDLRHPVTNDLIGEQLGRGTIYTKGTVLKESDLNQTILDALSDEDHPSHDYVAKRLSPVEDGTKQDPSVNEPFPGYSTLDEETALGIIKNLPSQAIVAAQAYEASHEGRASIVNYVIGYGEDATARQLGNVGGGVQEPDTNKAVNEIRTRVAVPEGGVVIQPGEGITGTGEPVIAPGSTPAPEPSDETDEGEANVARPKRQGRRPRTS